jgi:phosphoglycerate dehydrogenase-like enzyme
VKVLVAVHSPVSLWNIPAAHVEQLRAAFPQHTFVHVVDEAGVAAHVGDADVAFMSELRPAHLAAARQLRWVHSPAAGVGSMLFPEMLDSAVVLSNSRGMSAETIAEHVLGVTLALFRKLPLALRSQAARHWAQNDMLEAPPQRTIAGTEVLIVGLGSIGGACAWRFAALEATVRAVRRRVDQPMPPSVRSVDEPGRLSSLLPSADVVVLTAAQTRETRRMIGAAELRAMKAGAVLINVARGKLIDEAALVEALRTGPIGGAALDVVEHEPLGPESPLWDAPNVIITPHTSGFRPDHWAAATALFASNLRRFEAGEPLVNVVDKQAGY